MMRRKIKVDDFWSRLKLVIQEHGTTLDKMCKDIGTLPQNMKNKKWRKTFPKISELCRISEYFDVSLDYLILGK